MVRIEPFDYNITEKEVGDVNRLIALLHGDNASVIRKEDLQMVLDRGFIIFAVTGNDIPVSDTPWRTIVGMGTITFAQKITGTVAQIDDVIVNRDYQRQGIAKRIVAGLVEEARRRGVKQINLTARPAHPAANHLYQSLGFIRRETNVYRLML